MNAWTDGAFEVASRPLVAGATSTLAGATILVAPWAPVTDLALWGAAVSVAAWAWRGRGPRVLALLPLVALLADRPQSPMGHTTLSAGGATETYTVVPAQGRPRAHHLGFWLEGLTWDSATGRGSVHLREAATEDRLALSLAAGRATEAGPYVLVPEGGGRADTPATATLGWKLRGTGQGGEVTVPVGEEVDVAEGLRLRVIEVRSDFKRQGPALRVQVGQDMRWLFARYPDHDAKRRTGPVALTWESSSPAAVVRLRVSAARPSLRGWLAAHPLPVPWTIFGFFLLSLGLRGRPRVAVSALLVAAALWHLPGRTAPRLGGDFGAAPYAEGAPVTLNLEVGPAGGQADVRTPVLMRLPVGGAGAVLGGCALALLVALGGTALGGVGRTHARSALRVAGLLLAVLGIFLASRPWMGPSPDATTADVEMAINAHVPPPPGREIMRWTPSHPGPYAPGPAGGDLPLLALGAAAALAGARRP